jgi:hypothetical protein
LGGGGAPRVQAAIGSPSPGSRKRDPTSPLRGEVKSGVSRIDQH